MAEGIAFFGATDGRLFAVDADTGRIRWAFDTGGRINSSPSLADGRVCITTYAGSVFCLRQRDGHKLWSTYVKRDTFRYESFYASASTDGERLYTIARSGKIVALDATSGQHRLDRPRQLARLLDAGRRPRPDLRRRLQRRPPRVPQDGRAAALAVARRRADPRRAVRRRRPRVLLDARDGDVRRAHVDGKIVWRYGLGKYSPGIATERTYYFSLNGMLVAFRGRNVPA